MTYQGLYVKPHNKVSAPVVDGHCDFVKTEAEIMFKLCFEKHGKHKVGALAIAHSQINDRTPLRFFVTNQNRIFVNPKIVKHTEETVTGNEGCMSYPEKDNVLVKRWKRVMCEYQTFEGNKLSRIKTIKLKDLNAAIWQHEIDHMDGKDIFNI